MNLYFAKLKNQFMNHSKTYVSTLTSPARTPVFEGEKRLFGCDFYPSFSCMDSTGKAIVS